MLPSKAGTYYAYLPRKEKPTVAKAKVKKAVKKVAKKAAKTAMKPMC